MGLKGKMDSLAKKVGSINGLATKMALNTLGTKVENVIKANSLKWMSRQ
jgi:hypothetical protein